MGDKKVERKDPNWEITTQPAVAGSAAALPPSTSFFFFAIKEDLETFFSPFLPMMIMFQKMECLNPSPLVFLVKNYLFFWRDFLCLNWGSPPSPFREKICQTVFETSNTGYLLRSFVPAFGSCLSFSSDSNFNSSKTKRTCLKLNSDLSRLDAFLLVGLREVCLTYDAISWNKFCPWNW